MTAGYSQPPLIIRKRHFHNACWLESLLKSMLTYSKLRYLASSFFHKCGICPLNCKNTTECSLQTLVPYHPRRARW